MQFKAEGNGDYSNVLIDGYKNQTTPTVKKWWCITNQRQLHTTTSWVVVKLN
jgi:hypothetical protein